MGTQQIYPYTIEGSGARQIAKHILHLYDGGLRLGGMNLGGFGSDR